MKFVKLSRPRYWGKGYRGEIVVDGQYACLYRVGEGFWIGKPKPFGNGEVEEVVPCRFAASDFILESEMRLSAAQTERRWKLKGSL